MGVFKSEKFFSADSSLIPGIAEAIAADFRREEFKVDVVHLVSGGADVSLAKGGAFKAVMGMKSALKITLFPKDGGIEMKAGVGIFGQQAIPSLLSCFVAWPILITQIWGMVRQAKLDDRAIDIAERYIAEHAQVTPSHPVDKGAAFCTACGKHLPNEARFCPNCGVAVS